ncbi:hypothetical protein SAMN04487934_10122 [Eubacterium ruminantium]|nr:hypothetical protein SAMN04487934_10122 [Eubacterium ruminantium]
MKYCIYCGSQLVEESSFCNICGGRQPSDIIDNSKQNDVKQATDIQNNMNSAAPNAQQYYMNQVAPNAQQYSMNQTAPYPQQNSMNQAVPYPQQYSMNSAAPNSQQYNMNQIASNNQQPVGDTGLYSQQIVSGTTPYSQHYNINGAASNTQQYSMNQSVSNSQQYDMNQTASNSQLYNMTQPAPYPQQQMYGMPAVIDDNTKSGGPSTGKSKKKIIIPIVALLVIGLGVGGFFIFKKLTKKPQEKVLDSFFEALNNMDIEKAETYCAPEGTERYGDMIQYGALSNLYTNRFGFTRGIFDYNDMLRLDTDLMDMYLKSYGFSSSRDGGLEKRRQCEENNDMFRMKYSDFHVEYDLVSLKPASEYTISYQYKAKQIEIDDMAGTIESGMHFEEGDVTDVYVAKIHIKWRYGDKKYGYDKSWWSNSAFDSAKVNIHDSYGNKLGSYNEVVNYYDNIVYNVFIYEYKGKWYIYNPYIIRYYYSRWKAE